MISRRKVVALLAGSAGVLALTRRGDAAGAPPGSAAQPQKVSKQVAQYRDYPKGAQMCRMCKFYVPSAGGPGAGMMGGPGAGMMGSRGAGMMQLGSCQVVEGSISPMGWCMLYTPLIT